MVLPCRTVFDVVSVPAIFGRRMLDRLWDEGPGSGPIAVYRGRMLLFAAPGTAHRLPTLLEWEEWGSPGRTGAVPPLLCHGTGDAVTVPAVLHTGGDSTFEGDDKGIGEAAWRDAGRTRNHPPRIPLARRPGHPPTLASWARGTALGGRPGGPRECLRDRARIDFSSRRSGC